MKLAAVQNSVASVTFSISVLSMSTTLPTLYIFINIEVYFICFENTGLHMHIIII